MSLHDSLWIRASDGRDFVLRLSFSTMDLPEGAVAESPTGTLWRVRTAVSRDGLFGLREFLVRTNYLRPEVDLGGPNSNLELLERLIERGEVVGYFLQPSGTGMERIGGGASHAPLFAPAVLASLIPEIPAMGGTSKPPQTVDPGPAPLPPSPPSDLVATAATFFGSPLAPTATAATATAATASAATTGGSTASEGDPSLEAPESSVPPAATPPVVVPGATAAASTPKNLFPEHIFTVEVVDELGNFIPGIKLDFGPAAPVATDGNGPAVFKGKPSNAKVSFAEGQDIYKALVAARANRPATPAAKCLAPSADVLVFIARPGSLESLDGSPFAPFAMQAGEKKRVSLRPGAAKAKIFEVRDTLFRLKSAVVNPECEAPTSTLGDHPAESSVGLIANILRYNAEHRGLKIFIAGHTDTSGDAINKPLSEQRAYAVQALVEGNRKMFLDACTKYNSEVDATQVFDWSKRVFGFKCNPTTLTAAPSDTNYVLFRKSFNDWVDAGAKAGEKRGTKIDYNGRANVQPDIWGAFFDLYEYQLLQELGETANGLGELRGKLDWVNPQIKSRGYGETHPLSKPPLDGMHSQTDRRVEVMLFEANHIPDLAGDPQGNTLYDGISFEPVVIPPMTDATRVPVQVEVRDTSDSPIPGVTVELYLGTAVFGQSVTDTSGRCMVKGPRVPSIWIRIKAIDESVLKAGVSNNDLALFAEEYAEGRDVIVGSMIIVVLTPCTLAIALEATQVGSPKRTAELRSSDGTVVRTLPLPPPILDEVEQSVVFDDLPTFGKKYSLTIKTGSDEAIAFENLSIGALIAEIESARSDLVDIEPDSNRRQAALENPNTGIVVV